MQEQIFVMYQNDPFYSATVTLWLNIIFIIVFTAVKVEATF